MTKTVFTMALLLSLIIALKCSIVDATLFSNQKTGDNGIGVILNEHVYDTINKALCIFNLDDNGAIGDIKVIGTKQTYIVFEL